MMYGYKTRNVLSATWILSLIMAGIMFLTSRIVIARESGAGQDSPCDIQYNWTFIILLLLSAALTANTGLALYSETLTERTEGENTNPKLISVVDAIAKATNFPYKWVSVSLIVVICIVFAVMVFVLSTVKPFKKGQKCSVDETYGYLTKTMSGGYMIVLAAFYWMMSVHQDNRGYVPMDYVMEDEANKLINPSVAFPLKEGGLVDITLNTVAKEMDITITDEQKETIVNNILDAM